MKGFFKSRPILTLVTLVLLATALAASLAGTNHLRASAATSLPSGERTHGQSTLEPVYDDITGNVIYVMTPNKVPNAPLNPNPKSWADFYVPVYPVSASASVGTLQCIHTPAPDNCPDHGPLIAGIAASTVPAVYGNGVLGHDHLMAAPGSGGDFNIAWEPILVLFNTTEAANTHHLTTLKQIDDAMSQKLITEVPLPPATFHCEVVPAHIYTNSPPV